MNTARTGDWRGEEEFTDVTLVDKGGTLERKGEGEYLGKEDSIMELGDKEQKTSGIQEFRSSGVQEFRRSGVQEFRSSGVQEFKSSGVREFRSSGVQEAKSSGYQEL